MCAVCLEFEFHRVICVSAHLLLFSVSVARKLRIQSRCASYGPYIQPRNDPIFCTQLGLVEKQVDLAPREEKVIADNTSNVRADAEASNGRWEVNVVDEAWRLRLCSIHCFCVFS